MHTLEAPSGASGAKGVTYMPSSATLWGCLGEMRCNKGLSAASMCLQSTVSRETLLKTIQLEDSEEGNRLRGISLAGTQMRSAKKPV